MKAIMESFGEVTIVHLSGQIDYETADKFKDTCLKNFKHKKIVFNLDQLNFVGSSGITPFLETMETLSQVNKEQMKFCKVSTEFRRIFEVGNLKVVEICENLEQAQKSIMMSSVDPQAK
jgi:anti-anti-sigma factor